MNVHKRSDTLFVPACEVILLTKVTLISVDSSDDNGTFAEIP